jgi:hypothetical protein
MRKGDGDERRSGKDRRDGHLIGFEGYSSGEGPTLEEAITDAAQKTSVAGDDGVWFELSRVQAEIVGHNQYVRGFRVIITPT